jgi:hypothetical protein
VKGFVWKSHEHHTVEDCDGLPSGGPTAIASASLNHWATAEDVISAIESGARWVWGPSQDGGGRSAWDLPLPKWWPDLRDYLRETARPLALATSHLDAKGRAEFVETATSHEDLHCTITHSLYVELTELRELGSSGCSFEFDLYTYFYPIRGRPRRGLLVHSAALLESDYRVYLASDCGQAHVGNPFRFSTAALAELAKNGGEALVRKLAVEGPDQFVSRILEPADELGAGQATV